jgi:hypothetical protein
MTNKIALNTVRWAFLLSFFGLSSAAEAQNLPSAPRDFFIGQWERWNNGDTFFPDKILFEADPETTDRLLVTFTLGCMYPAPSCSATKARSSAVFWTGGGVVMVHVPWFKDAAGSQYDVSFQQMPEQVRLVPNAIKGTNAYFSITPSFNREAELQARPT